MGDWTRRLTSWYFSDEVRCEEGGSRIGEIVASQLEVLVETHHRCVLEKVVSIAIA